ncbi:uncharacterized protein LOC114318160 [Camellia sinensis]|uniref:uncharacterized protein LOC114318160 n=1 Tax=Camellia sinensis TaxID=4442 RepID=UPI0010368F88|nr:uncharacterized protein LOC114318160 [Camellia sinensis]
MDLRLQLDFLLQKQELYWAQRSKQQWLHLGDRNTNLFHQMAYWRRSQNRISCIQDKDGTVLTHPQDIQRAFVEHFQQLFSPLPDSNNLHMDSLDSDFPQQRIVVDGSWISVTDRTGLAWVWLDADNHIVKHEAILGPPMLSTQQTEAASVLHAMRWASQQGIQCLLLQTDCLVLVQLLHTFKQQ